MIVFVIPAYNEGENIQTLLTQTAEKMRKEKLPYKIIIINDGSTDDTLNQLEAMKDSVPIEVYSHYPNKGVGEAFRVGFLKALQFCNDDDIVVTKEADNTSDLGILPELISQVQNGYDVALASCYREGGAIKGASFYRLLLSKAANRLLKLFFPIKEVHTFTSFYRAYSYRSIKEALKKYGSDIISEPGFECMAELLIKLSRISDLRITEVPTVLDVTKRVDKSKMHVSRTIRGVLKIIVKEAIIYRFINIFGIKFSLKNKE